MSSDDGDSTDGAGALGGALADGLGALTDALGSGADTEDVREGLNAADEAVRGATGLVGAAQNIGEIADGIQTGDAGGTLSSLGGLGGAAAGVTAHVHGIAQGVTTPPQPAFVGTVMPEELLSAVSRSR